MYQDYFGLNRKPFGIVPDTRFLFLSDSHKEAIAHLVYALNEKNGFVQLTGEVGVGKTMACRYILANMPKDIDVALIINPRINEVGLLRTLCQELDIQFTTQQLTNELTQLINVKLLQTHAEGRHTILIVDEAQNLPKQTLEQIRLLTNLETDTQKLLRIILIGQPELGQLLAEHDMRQVAQRITSRYHLSTLEADETDQYISHRLKTAGCDRRIFSKSASRRVHKLTEGTPRLINLLCDRALIGAYSMGENEVSASIVNIAAKEALPYVKNEPNSGWPRWLPILATILLLSSLAIGYQAQWRNWLSNSWPKLMATLPALDNMQTPPSKVGAQATTENIPPETFVPNQQSAPAVVAPKPAIRPPTQKPQRNQNAEENSENFETFLHQAEVDFRLGIPTNTQSPPEQAPEQTPK